VNHNWFITITQFQPSLLFARKARSLPLDWGLISGILLDMPAITRQG